MALEFRIVVDIPLKTDKNYESQRLPTADERFQEALSTCALAQVVVFAADRL